MAKSTVCSLDSAVLDLSKRITSEAELVDLGVSVLKLPEYTIDAALYDKKEIQSAAHKVLRTWMKQQTDGREAYRILYASLKRCDMKELAAVLRQRVEDVMEPRSLTAERKYNVACDLCVN